MSKRYFTDKQYKQLLSHMVILHAGNEQVNDHIIDYFDKNKIKHKEKALHTGDYSFMIEKNEELGMLYDLYYTDSLVIERKNSIDELAGNISEKSGRFMRELARFREAKECRVLVENNSIDDIFLHNYRSKTNELSYIRSLLTLERKYSFHLEFIKKENMGFYIYEICKNHLDSKILK